MRLSLSRLMEASSLARPMSEMEDRMEEEEILTLRLLVLDGVLRRRLFLLLWVGFLV